MRPPLELSSPSVFHSKYFRSKGLSVLQSVSVVSFSLPYSKYAYLCNFSHKWSNFGFLRGFFSRNCEFYANSSIKCADFRFILENVYTSVFGCIRSYTLVYARRGCIRLFLLNTRSNNAITQACFIEYSFNSVKLANFAEFQNSVFFKMLFSV